ncbi:Ribosomal RNA small subunit methyltransferase E [Luteitalea pratensis]|uniref:Ribosomal RNA small subunit methyltransferase E n=1 Tax=Luteitalea pratensis TaxID=1855912 RepID=A0A143PTJ2_LUTPR|nr:RsmE family RNA methyltransferase [Luteitalea pratensis]AMY11149.1 Ribosomal RNA small subunit methyltransferase E [Luteitalea pratensis]
MPPRFHAPDLNIAAADVVLPEGESAHLCRVLRLHEGDDVEVFDGRGALHAGVVRTASPRASVVTVGAARAAAPEPPAPIIVAQALLKGDAMDAVIRDATVLGAVDIWPMTTSRTNVPARAADAAHERWLRVAVAAAKQCGRAVIPRIAPVRSLAGVLGDTAASGATRLWLTEPAASAGDSADVPVPARAVCLAIGPEGGWTAEEMAAASDAGWEPWTLAPVTLRAEQMTVAALSVVRYAWDVAARRRNT